jgi:hypothetical protein
MDWRAIEQEGRDEENGRGNEEIVIKEIEGLKG